LVNASWLFLFSERLVLLYGFSAWWLSFATIAIGLFVSENKGDVYKRHTDVAV
jgi:hypothetical protein